MVIIGWKGVDDMPWLFERENDSNIGVDRIHSEDAMINWWTYQHLIDIAICNCHKPVTETALRKELKAQLDMAVEDMMECFELCKGKMLEEINKGR